MAVKIGVAIHHAPDLRLGRRGGVVQDHAAFGHAILDEVVMRHARRIRRGDIDLVDAVLGLVQRRLGTAGMGIDHDLRLCLLGGCGGHGRGQEQGDGGKDMHAALKT
ncbi:hypothetical protein MSKU15_3546 [Komagataeibacter diospyri]|nr:hypothetical protein MSKU15_3546 [Komagataeibacter diospyri]